MNIKELKKKMIDNNIDTFDQLSKVTGLSYDPLTKCVRGERKLRLDEARKIQVALNIDSDEFQKIFFDE